MGIPEEGERKEWKKYLKKYWWKSPQSWWKNINLQTQEAQRNPHLDTVIKLLKGKGKIMKAARGKITYHMPKNNKTISGWLLVRNNGGRNAVGWHS